MKKEVGRKNIKERKKKTEKSSYNSEKRKGKTRKWMNWPPQSSRLRTLPVSHLMYAKPLSLPRPLTQEALAQEKPTKDFFFLFFLDLKKPTKDEEGWWARDRRVRPVRAGNYPRARFPFPSSHAGSAPCSGDLHARDPSGTTLPTAGGTRVVSCRVSTLSLSRSLRPRRAVESDKGVPQREIDGDDERSDACWQREARRWPCAFGPLLCSHRTRNSQPTWVIAHVRRWVHQARPHRRAHSGLV